MNAMKAKVEEIKSDGCFSRITIRVKETVLKLLKAVDIKLLPVLDSVSYEKCKEKVYQAN